MSKTLPAPGPIARRAVTQAEANIGVTDGGKNWGTFIRIYLAAVMIFSPAAWCLAFQVFRLEDAAKYLGLKLPSWVPITGYTPTFVNGAKKAGRFYTTAEAKATPSMIQRGDLVFFYFENLGRIGHVGVVTAVYAWGVETVEGNTSPEAGTTVQRDGDGVYAKKRNWSELGDPSISGFVRLDF